jgi:hypothetical protein
MPNGDGGVPTDLGLGTTERDLGKEFSQASEIGRLVLDVTSERTERPEFEVRRYSMPMLDLLGYPPSAIEAIVSKKEQITDDDIASARRASVVLAVESAVQIVGAKQTPGQITEEPRSLENVLNMINRGAGLIIQIESSDQPTIVKAGRTALEKRKGVTGLEGADSWDDQRVVSWTKEMFSKAGNRLKRSISLLEDYQR